MPVLRTPETAPTAAAVQALYERTLRWGRWGPDDQRGALNLLTPERVLRARELVRSGTTVGCSLPIATTPAADNPVPAQHHMLADGHTRRASTSSGLECSTDYLGLACHGMSITHLDAFCHVFVNGSMWNGRPAEEVTARGAASNDVSVAANGIVGRGVLLDIPRFLGRDWIEPGEMILADDLERCAASQGTPIEQGDLLLITTGRDARRRALGAWNPSEVGLAGLHHECVEWIFERDLAVIGSDGVSDPLPGTRNGGWPMPIHQCCLVGMGVHLLDNLALDALAQQCAERGAWDFLLAVGPLHAVGATGCAVNPVAVL